MHTSSVWLLGILSWGVLVLLLGMFRGETSIATYWDLKKSRFVLRQTVDSLSQQNDALVEEISKIRQSASYAERILRDKYHVVTEGEKIVFFEN